jgi:ribonuclease HI
MDEKHVWTIHTDGGARGNPGPAAFAYIIGRPGEPPVEEMGHLGTTTNNIAEYTALVRALDHAHKLGGKRLVLNSDSELMVNQMNGVYKVKNPGIRPLYDQAKELTRKFDSVTIRHVYREQNSRADALCNEALDNPRRYKAAPLAALAAPAVAAPAVAAPAVGTSAAPSQTTAASARSRASAAPPLTIFGSREQAFRERAVECLKAAAQTWAEGDATRPDPETVCDALWGILREEGLLN